MATKSGTNATAKIGSTVIADLAEWEFSDETVAIKKPVFGDTNNKIHGMGVRTVVGRVAGCLNIDDTNGQNVLETAYESKTTTSGFKLCIDDTNYYAADTATDADAAVYFTSANISAAVDEVIPVEFTFEVSGAWSRLQE